MNRPNRTKNRRNRNRNINRSKTQRNYNGAGLIILSPDCQHTLLVKGIMYPQKWGFPKGHREIYDESELQTALREVREETGLTENDFSFISDSFRSLKNYIFHYAFLKKPIAEIEIKPQPEEITDFMWGSIDLLLKKDEIYEGGNIHLRHWIDDLSNNHKLSTIIFNRSRICR